MQKIPYYYQKLQFLPEITLFLAKTAQFLAKKYLNLKQKHPIIARKAQLLPTKPSSWQKTNNFRSKTSNDCQKFSSLEKKYKFLTQSSYILLKTAQAKPNFLDLIKITQIVSKITNFYTIFIKKSQKLHNLDNICISLNSSNCLVTSQTSALDIILCHGETSQVIDIGLLSTNSYKLFTIVQK